MSIRDYKEEILKIKVGESARIHKFDILRVEDAKWRLKHNGQMDYTMDAPTAIRLLEACRRIPGIGRCPCEFCEPKSVVKIETPAASSVTITITKV